jgi:hypothetical protein
VLLICGHRNHTTMMHAIARALPDGACGFTPYYGDEGRALDWLRRLGLLEFVALGDGFRRSCFASLRANDLAYAGLALGKPTYSYRGAYEVARVCREVIMRGAVVREHAA